MTITDMTARPSGRRWAVALGLLGAVWYGFGLVQMGLGVTLDTKAAVAAGAMTAEHAAAVNGTPALIWLALPLRLVRALSGQFCWCLASPPMGCFAHPCQPQPFTIFGSTGCRGRGLRVQLRRRSSEVLSSR